MGRMDVILEVLLKDLRWLGIMTGIAGLVLFVPAVITGFLASYLTPPTARRDVPAGIVRGWLSGLAAAIIWTLLLLRLGQLLGDVFRPRSNTLAIATTFVFLTGYLICPFIGYFYSARYFWWKRAMKSRIDGADSQPRSRFGFSLRTWLVLQIVLVAVFGLWITARRDWIRARTEGRELEIWQAGLQVRLGGHGWELQYKIPPLHLYSWDKPLTDFNDDVLDKILLSDRLKYLEVNSDGLTDEGLKKLAMHQDLQALKANSQQLTDAGIAHLKHLPKLERVQLTAPQLTDKSLDELQTIATLRSVRIYSNTTITPEAVARFKDARPEVEIWAVSWK